MGGQQYIIGSANELRGKLRRRFYGGIIFLACLNKSIEKTTQCHLGHEEVDHSEAFFQRFLNCLALICDTRRGGDTVTAVAVVGDPATIWFASNSQPQSKLEETRDFIAHVLRLLGSVEALTPALTNKLRSEVLKMVLWHCKPRIFLYLKKLGDNIRACCSHKPSHLNNSHLAVALQTRLGEIEALASSALDSTRGPRDFASACERLVEEIHGLGQSDKEVWQCIKQQASEMNQVASLEQHQAWVDLKHYMGRFNAFYNAATAIVEARRLWPAIFQFVQVSFINSAPKGGSVLEGSAPTPRIMIGRISDGVEKIDMCAKADMLEDPLDPDQGLTSEMKRLYERKGCPVVHAEVLLFDWLHREGYTHPTHFFRGFQCIGASKPTCRLCYYYFEEHESGMRVRPSHQNVYPAWKLPDVDPSHGEAATTRDKMARDIFNRVKKDIRRALEERTVHKSSHDSTTETTSNALQTQLLLGMTKLSLEKGEGERQGV